MNDVVVAIEALFSVGKEIVFWFIMFFVVSGIILIILWLAYVIENIWSTVNGNLARKSRRKKLF